MFFLGESYEFYETSQNNELAEEIVVGFDHTTSSFRPEIYVDILQYVLFLEKFCYDAIETQQCRKCWVVCKLTLLLPREKRKKMSVRWQREKLS